MRATGKCVSVCACVCDSVCVRSFAYVSVCVCVGGGRGSNVGVCFITCRVSPVCVTKQAMGMLI